MAKSTFPSRLFFHIFYAFQALFLEIKAESAWLNLRLRKILPPFWKYPAYSSGEDSGDEIFCLIPSLQHSDPQRPRYFWSALCQHQEAGPNSGPIWANLEPSLPWTRVTIVAMCSRTLPPRTNGETGGRERLRKISFSSQEAALLLVSTKNRDLWPGLRPGPTTFQFLNGFVNTID